MAPDTATLPLDSPDRVAEPFGPYLAVALDGAHPARGGARISLANVDELLIGRGDTRDVEASRRRKSLRLPDRALSSEHATLVRRGSGWILEDRASKNGSFVRGQRVDGAVELEDGDLLEVARTVLLFRNPGGTLDPSDRDVTLTDDALASLNPVIEAALVRLRSLAASPAGILIQGETGTGKELWAQAAHIASGRPGSCVAVNCAALAPTLIESELFGYRRGAFSGAVDDRPGLLRTADAGTLFLDELAELSTTAQAGLLRALQEREVLPIGATKPVKVDFRVVAATCADLPALVALGRFRKDLFARIAGAIFCVSPLRARPEDLGLLVGRLLARHGGADRGIERAAARALFRHDWPLNVRELEHALIAALATGTGEISFAALPESLRSPTTSSEVAPPRRPVDREVLLRLVEDCRGNISRMAQALGTSRSQVRRLAARFAVDLEAYRE